MNSGHRRTQHNVPPGGQKLRGRTRRNGRLDAGLKAMTVY
jgi:hypothetical protein